MASTYVNDLRLNEMATGDASGSWGTITNTNLELIGEAFGYGTESIGNADTTITMADGASDAARSFYLKITSSADLTTTRVITLAPNTVSKVWMIENATSGSQIITIKQGTGATINIPNGHVKMVATDGAGSGGAVLDLLTDLNVATNLFVKNAGTGDGSTANIYLQTAEADIAADDVIGKINFQAPNEGTGTDAILVSAAIQAISEGDFSSSSNATSLNFMTGASEAATTKMTLSSAGNLTVTGIVDVTDTTDASDATGDTGALRTEGGASIAKKLYVGTDLDVDGTTNLDVVDIDGAVDMASTLQVDGAITSSAGATITTADNTTQLTLKSTDADASAGPRFDLTRDSASPDNGDNIGRIRYLFDNDAGEQTEGIRIDGVLQDVSDGTEDVAYVIDTIISGTLRERVGYRAAETVFNDDSQDVDFRVESNGSAYALFVDGGNNHVNIMTSTDLGAVLNVSGNAYIQHADNSDTLTLECTDADTNSGPNLRLYRNSANPVQNDLLGNIQWEGRNNNSQDVIFAEMRSQIETTTDDSEDANFKWSTMVGGTLRDRLSLNANTTVFNDDSIDVDFRVESNGNANMLFVDGGNNRVGIGTNSPAHALDVNGSLSSNGNENVMRIAAADSTNAGGVTINSIYAASASARVTTIFSIDGQDQASPLAFGTGTTERARINPDGKLLIGNSTSQTTDLLQVESPASGGGHGIAIRRNDNNTDQQLGRIMFGNTADSDIGQIHVKTTGATNTGAMIFSTASSGTTAERMRILSSGNVLVGQTTNALADTGHILDSSGTAYHIRDGASSLILNRKSSDGSIAEFYKDGSAIGNIGVTNASLGIGQGDTGLGFFATDNILFPSTAVGLTRDNAIDLGYGSGRFDDIYATNATIQTSDQTEKQDIAALTSTEMLVGKRISALFKTFRWKDKVASKGDNARTHTGIIAQDVQAAFTAEGLDAGDYSLFISSTWLVDSEGNEVEEGTEGAVSKTRMGIRYPELLSFVAAYNEQRFANIETRLTALEG